jgi:hypothetical protein
MFLPFMTEIFFFSDAGQNNTVKVGANVLMYVINQGRRNEDVRRRAGIAPHTLNGNRWR